MYSLMQCTGCMTIFCSRSMTPWPVLLVASTAEIANATVPPAAERVSGLLHNAHATILAINDIDRGPVPPPGALPTSAFGKDHACRQPRRLHSPAAAQQQQQAHQQGRHAGGWQCGGLVGPAEAAGAADQGPELGLHTEAVGPSAVTADPVTMWEGLDCLGLPELNSAEL